MHGRDFCVRYSSRSVVPPLSPGQRHLPLELDLQSQDWQSGVARGVATNLAEAGGTDWDVRLIITFPSDL